MKKKLWLQIDTNLSTMYRVEKGMTENTHKNRCKNGCIRRMDVEEKGNGQFSYYKRTLDCPAQISADSEFDQDIVETISLCGCCSFDNGSSIKKPEDCRLQEGKGDYAACTCHNTQIVYATCLSKRNHGACPYGLKGVL